MTTAKPEGVTLHNLHTEDRRFPPSEVFAQAANAGAGLFDEAAADVEGFWAKQARELVAWDTPFSEVLDWSEAPVAKWFADGTLNASVSCLDRHVAEGRGEKVALHWVGEPGDTRDVTYQELLDETSRVAHVLTDLGVEAGSPVVIYMPMVPEAVAAMLACARLGAPHSVVFAGFSSEALAARINDIGATVVITTDGCFRKGKVNPLKPIVDEALTHAPSVTKVLVSKRTDHGAEMTPGRDVWWDDVVPQAPAQHEPTSFPAEHPLFVLYTSGTTGSPKGILHTTGGYLTQAAYTHTVVHDIKPESDVYWCSADIGWITGHSYIVYGPLACGTSQVMYEGTPDTPHKGRWWEIIEAYSVSILYTAPTAIRTFMKWGDSHVTEHDVSSLRLLGTVGEPINPEAWMWYHKVIGGESCPIVDTWWQTETGGMMISPLPGVTATVPGSAQHALPGIGVDIVNDQGESVGDGEGGYLVLTHPWPGMLRGIWGDMERYREGYWSRFPGKYFAGDGAKRDADGNIWLLGRVDDVLNVSGHRMSTAEIEHALVSHPFVAEAAVVGAADERTGQAISAFVILREEAAQSAETVADLRAHVSHEIGAIAKPRDILVVPELPKTRSGKIMRRLLRDVAEHRPVGDVTTLSDHSVVDLISERLQAAPPSEG